MAGGDIRQRLKPGQTMPIGVAGDYIYLKFADRDISVVITDGMGTQKPVVMAVGDKYRPGPFRQFAITNTDNENPAQVVLTVGTGDFSRQVVTGEISVIPGIRKADGTWKDDERKHVDLTLFRKPGFQPTVINQGDIVAVNQTVGGAISDYGISYIGAEIVQKAVAMDHNNKIVTTFTTLADPTRTGLLKLDSVDAAKGTIIACNFYSGGAHPSVLGYMNNGKILFSIGQTRTASSDAEKDTLYSVSENGGSVTQIMRPLRDESLNGGIFEHKGQVYIAYSDFRKNERGFYILDAETLTQTGKITVSDNAKRYYTSDGKKIYSIRDVSGYPMTEHDEITLEPIGEAVNTGWQGNIAGITKAENRITVWESKSTGQWSNKGIALKKYQKTAGFYVGFSKNGCARISRVPTVYDTGANITIIDHGDDTATMKGEVVRAVLDAMKAEEQVTPTYRDHVYGLTVTNNPSAGFELAGATMQAAKIDDDFAIKLPATVTVTIDNNLKFEGY